MAKKKGVRQVNRWWS